jgi:hypothetical protein
LLVRPNDARGSDEKLDAFGTVIQDAARRSGCAYLDDRSVIGSFSQATAAGFMFPDGVHPHDAANKLRGGAYARRVAALLNGPS